mmetsp:Transcript_16400/g.38447  ORF Transcript_16400/g.38447 Transcript_16400/m.38447 type:complete len:279 (+) Transcript_16400:34-870(+)
MAAWSVIKNGCGGSAKVQLREGQRIKAEPDALITMSHHIELGASMDAGFLRGVMRAALGQESVFSQTLQAKSGDGDVVLGAKDIGDVEIIQVRQGPLLLQKGAFLAADEAVDVALATQRSFGGALLSGTGLFVLRAAGQGSLAVTAHGSILRFDLQVDEVRAVDNGHLVAWSEALRLEMKLASGGRGIASALFSSAASGEGLMCFFTGPGSVWLQTHKPPQLPPKGRDAQCSPTGVLLILVVLLVLVLFGLLFAWFGFAQEKAAVGARPPVRARLGEL